MRSRSKYSSSFTTIRHLTRYYNMLKKFALTALYLISRSQSESSKYATDASCHSGNTEHEPVSSLEECQDCIRSIIYGAITPTAESYSFHPVGCHLTAGPSSEWHFNDGEDSDSAEDTPKECYTDVSCCCKKKVFDEDDESPDEFEETPGTTSSYGEDYDDEWDWIEYLLASAGMSGLFICLCVYCYGVDQTEAERRFMGECVVQ